MKKRIFLSTLVFVLNCISATTSNASEPSKAEIAQALAFSGCTWGLSSSNYKSDLNVEMELTIYAGLVLAIIDNGSTNKSLLKMDIPRVRSGSEHVKQSWVTAGALDPKWKVLTQSYTDAINVGIKKWNSGSNLGVAQKAANAASNATLTSICRIAQIGVYNKGGTSYPKVKAYIIKTAGKYLPPLPSSKTS